jgi:5-methylcytosine-specific restriction endonuclease McrA
MPGYLNDNVLILNRNYGAVNIASARRVFALLWQGHCKVLLPDWQTLEYQQWREASYGYDGEDVVGCVGYKLRVPSVIVLTLFDRLPHKEVRFTRHNLFERDRDTCQYCGHRFKRSELNLDHVTPREHGGQSVWTNLVTSCIPCNSHKANRTPEQAGMRLIRQPKRPNWRPSTAHIAFEKIQKPDWEPHLNVAGWNVEVSGHKPV